MSRIGRKTINIPAEVSLIREGNELTVKGKKGELSLTLPEAIDMKNEDNAIEVFRLNELKKTKALHGLYRSLISNAVTGVSDGFTKKLILNGVGWKMEVRENYLVLNLGYSHPIYFRIPEGIVMEATQPVSNVSELKVSGIDKEFVGLLTAKIRSFRKPEPYKGKGFRYSDETIIRKAGKTAK